MASSEPPGRSPASNGGGGAPDSSPTHAGTNGDSQKTPPIPTSSTMPSLDHPAPSSSSVLAEYPHLGHYILNLLATISPSLPRGSQHPLSVSSSGESDGSDDDNGASASATDDGAEDTHKTPSRKPSTSGSGGGGGGKVDKDALIRKIVDLLDNDEEEGVKDVLKPHMGDLAKVSYPPGCGAKSQDEILMDQVCLDCMHRRKGAPPPMSPLMADDMEQLPYAPHITPSRARGSPALTSHPLRPYTPTRIPSFKQTTLGRPSSPSIPSGARTPTYPPHVSSGLGRSEVSPKLSAPVPADSSASLNAKAASFNPSPRITSAPLPGGSFLPSDPWKDAPPPIDPPRTSSPFGRAGATGMVRTGSNLAIATPLFSNQSSPFHSPIGTPSRAPSKLPDVFNSPSLAPPAPSKGIIPDDDDDDEFSPFGSKLPKLHHQEGSSLNTEAKPFEPFGHSDGAYGSSSNLSTSIPHSESSASHGSSGGDGEMTAEEYGDMAGGMTPLDVLHSVFTSLPREELEGALHRSGYDFEGAMAILVSQHTLPRSGSSTPQRVASPRPLLGVGGRGAVPGMHNGPSAGYFQAGGRGYGGHSPGLPRSPGGHATRMCRYYLQGECRRSDCRFSHDLDRALCRFWLRGNCAKGPNCEFLHQFPNNFDPHALTSAMNRIELTPDGSVRSPVHTLQDEFPELYNMRHRPNPGARFDPSRNRFANAVKKMPPAAINMPTFQISGAKYTTAAPSGAPAMDTRPIGPAQPKQSLRLKLRPPTLLPTLSTGSSANEQYLNARQTAIRLGYARNACLARAADAFRRGDGAAAKRFSREGKTLNERMMNEANEAAQVLVRERRQEAQKAVRERDSNWSDDPGDRGVRGRECAGGLGVIMGVASPRRVGQGSMLSADERTECLLDLHTLHGNEGTEVLGQFLGDLERENYRGLAYIVVGEEKHVGTQDPGRGASKIRLGTTVKQYLAEWGYPWDETAGIICVDPCR